MKILRKGAPWSLTVACSQCQSLLMVEENDVLLVPKGTRGADFGKTVWKCPICKTTHDIEVPEHVSTIAHRDADWNVGQGL